MANVNDVRMVGRQSPDFLLVLGWAGSHLVLWESDGVREFLVILRHWIGLRDESCPTRDGGAISELDLLRSALGREHGDPID